jgi:hypothetical protein
MAWDTTDMHDWQFSRVWFTCISQFRKDMCNKQDVPKWNSCNLACLAGISQFAEVVTFSVMSVPEGPSPLAGHWKAHILYIDHIQGIVSPVDPLVSGRSLLPQKVAVICQIAISIFFPVAEKKFGSPDWDVTRLTCPSFCLLNLISVCWVNLRCLRGGLNYE